MNEADTLNVWHGQQIVGQLWRDVSGAIGFRYDSGWGAGDNFAVSHSLPLANGTFEPAAGIAHRFFANLLPEGAVREQIVRDLRLPNTDFDLLRAIGGECAGALSILRPRRQPAEQRRYFLLTEKLLTDLAMRRTHIYSYRQDSEHTRFSLAGAQDKCAVLSRDDQFFLPQGEAPSSHILKFEVANYRHIPAYETFTTQLAAAIGLPTVQITLHRISRTSFARITRYDRVLDQSGELQRLHQEDFCQALGFGNERKYQEDGGPSFAQCFRLVQDVSSEPAEDSQNLLRWQIFNVLAGNSDGHAKNLSLLYLPDDSIRLASFYDLVCTRAIKGINNRLAFDIGSENNPSMINLSHWRALAKNCDVRPQFLENLAHEIAHHLLEKIGFVRKNFETAYGDYPVLQRVEGIVKQQCHRLIKKTA